MPNSVSSHRREFERALRAYSSAAYALMAAWHEMDSKKNPNAAADNDEANKHFPDSINVSFDEHAHMVGRWYLRMIGEE